jgi:hypothetical protein
VTENLNSVVIGVPTETQQIFSRAKWKIETVELFIIENTEQYSNLPTER